MSNDLTKQESIAYFSTNLCKERLDQAGWVGVKQLLRFDSILSMVMFGYKIGVEEIGEWDADETMKQRLMNEAMKYRKNRHEDFCKALWYLSNVIK
jgi:hypothetical protein